MKKITLTLCIVLFLFSTITPSFAKNDQNNSPPRGETPKVELYSTSWCPYCKKAANFFRSHNISFVEYDIEKDKDAARRRQQLDPRRGVPFAVINGHKILGYSENAYLIALGMDD